MVLRRKLLSAAFLLVTMSIACSGGRPVSALPPLGEPMARDLAGLVRIARLIIVGEVVAIQPGRVAGQGEARMQFNDVLIRLEKTLKGSASETIAVERVAAPPGEVIMGLGPSYQRGERYLLFLRPGEIPRYIPVRQGRYRLEHGRVYPTSEGPVANQLRGKEATALLGQIATILATQP
jgi:hypothetical protein